MKNKDKIDSGSVIALIGAGKGGLALLKVLLRIPAVKIKYVCDTDPYAVGILYAKNHDINCTTDCDQIIVDEEVNLIFEATGDPRIFKKIDENKSPKTSLIGADGSKIIFQFLDAYNEVNKDLKEYKVNLEKKIIERTEDLEVVNTQLEKEMLEYEKISQKLKEINNEKTKYLLYATHQLKAPFAAIQSYVDIILEGYTGKISPETRDIVQKIKRRCELLSRVIKEMLELEKLKSRDEIVLDLKKINISSILTYMVQQSKISAKIKKIKIDFTPIKEDLYIKGSKRQIEILFSILLENAINYSPSKSIVKIITKKIEGPRIYIGIEDQGIGIPEKNIGNVFNEFFRSNNAVDFHKNGTGLGLSVAREIINIHNGSINVESVLEQGSCFSVAFKLI
ncbi:MAG: HAMP domain-containing histidine kinase [Actinomycetia bacterium]|nr:HAMP domain-containing histidine kinase [Actinomycetes bacterium]